MQHEDFYLYIFRYVKGVWWWSRSNRKLGSNCLEVHEQDQTKRYIWKNRTFLEKFLKEEKFTFQRKISSVISDHDIPSELVLNVDQTPLSYVSPGKYTCSLKGAKNVPIKCLDYKRQIAATFVVTTTGSFLPIQLIYQGKSKRCLPKFTFPSDFHVTFTANCWSNLEKCEDLFNVIIFLYLSAKKKEFGYPEAQRSLIIMDIFNGKDNDEMKRLSTKNNYKLVIVHHNRTRKFQLLDISVNQNEVAPGDIKTSLKLSGLKPFQDKWIPDTYNHLRKQNDSIIKGFKGYLHYKTIFCHKVALDAQLMNFFVWSKNNVLFTRYLDFCVFVKSTDIKICDFIISIAT